MANRNPYEFQKYVGMLFEQLGYRVVPQFEIHANRVDFVIERADELNLKERILIECKTGTSQSIDSSIYNTFNQLYKDHRSEFCLTRAMFVYDCNVTDHVQRSAIQHPNDTQLVPLDQLERSAFGTPVKDLSAAAASELQIRGPFVDPGIIDLKSNISFDNTFDHITTVSKTEGTIVFLLGTIGSGKTTLLSHFVSKNSMTADRVELPTPIYLLIPLRYYAPNIHYDSILSYVADYVRMKGIIPNCSALLLRRLLSSKQVALVLDGLDETRLLVDTDQIYETLDRWLAELGEAWTTLFSCRSSYFNSYFPELRARVQGIHKDKIELLQVKPFSVETVIRYAEAARSPALLNALRKHGFNNLMTRPLFLSTAQKVQDLDNLFSESVTEVEFVERAVTLMLRHSAATRVAPRSTYDWIAFLTHLAGGMLNNRRRLLSRQSMKSAIEAFWGTEITITELDTLLKDAMFRSILEVTDGNFEFAHHVFYEYFKAKALTELGEHSAPALYATEGHDVSSRFGLSAYDHFLHAKTRKRGRWVIKQQYGIRWCLVPSGVMICRTFDSRRSETHKVRIVSKAFWVSESPIILEQLQSSLHLITDSNLRSKIEGQLEGPGMLSKPLTNVTNTEAKQICAQLFNGRLPNEFEWQWACMPFQTSRYYHTIGSRRAAPSLRELPTGAWGIKGGLRSVWQWTSTYDTISGCFVCCGGWWGDETEGAANWRLLPAETQHARTGIRVLIEAADFDRG